jgi:signal transduction histidine kinase
VTAPRELRKPAAIVLGIFVLAGVYIAAARAGLALDAVSGFATLVWAPSGISLAALIIFGRRLWPGVAIGALGANLLTGAPLVVAAGIAVGNTGEALIAMVLLHRAGFRPSLDRLRDVLALLTIAALASTAVSATVGVASLQAGGLVAAGAGLKTWLAWWIGDMMGDVLVAPVLLVWLCETPHLPRGRRLGEAVALGVAALVVSGLVFGVASSSDSPVLAQAYLLFPVLIWAALRFGQTGAVSTAFLVSIVAVWGTVIGRGPFGRSELYQNLFDRPELHQSLFALQTFLGVAAATFLILGATSAERYQAVRELEAAVEDARLARDLAAAANRTKADFLAVMSHELRTPLNAILGYSDLLDMGVQGELSAKQKSTIDRIRSNQRQLESLVEDLLSFTRIEAGRLTVDLHPVAVAEILDAVEETVGRDARRRSIKLWRNIEDPALMVHADAVRLRQVVLNLAGNAVKFTPDGGSITITARRDGGRVRLQVTDTGIGIPHDQLANVFEPFFQVEGGKTRPHGGVGLGLAIARDLVTAMHGTIRLESELGKGTVATVELPAA